MRFVVVGLLAVLLSGCRERELITSVGQIRLEPKRVNFGNVYSGQTAETTMNVRNLGLSPRSLTWTLTGEGFEVDQLPQTAPSGDTAFLVRFVPTDPADFTGTLDLRVEAAEGEGEPSVLSSDLFGSALAMPECPQPISCHKTVFDPVSGQCLESEEPDGTACETHSVCVSNATCQAGRCVGEAVTCDDGNACTVDVCNAVNGCEHLPAPPCPGDGKCQVGVCNPQTGCGLAPAVDGTACGPVQTCDSAQVCISGACQLRDPPDGYVCAQASPCQAEGRCAGSTCMQPAATVLTENWSFDSATGEGGDAGYSSQQLHDFVLEPSGAISMMGFFQTAPQLRVNTAQPAQAEGPSRRCMLWNNRMICADYPAAVNGKVSALDMATGATVWTFDLRTARPDFLQVASTLFLGRMAVQGTDRLAALYEAYPKAQNPNANTNCRLYFLVVLDASGGLVSAQRVTDPVLDVCNHPHPYGFGADAVGNLFVSFSPTIGMPAPLVPGSPTAVMSFTRDGVFRWKFTDSNLRGGELAVATGLLYPENSPVALLAATGEPMFTLSQPFGRLVVTKERSVLSPLIGGTKLDGYEAGRETKRWSHQLGMGESFFSEEIRLANWQTKTGERTVALTFIRRDDVPGGVPAISLHAIDTRDGSKAFTCDVHFGYRTGPQLLEVAENSMGLMEGSDACGKCDPPYAASNAAFHTFKLPLITPAHEPWVGTFGGPGHDHREEVLFNAPGVGH